MPDKPKPQGRQMTLREWDGRIVPHPAEFQSVREKPGNAGVGKAARISRESDRTPSVLSDGFTVLNEFEAERKLKNMAKSGTVPSDIDEYIAQFPPDVRNILETIRETIGKAAPDAEEAIKYQLPTFVLNGSLVHFGGFQNHIGFYPTPSGIEAFKDELSKYKAAKGSVQSPLDKPIPYSLIAKIAKFRVKENAKKPSKKK